MSIMPRRANPYDDPVEHADFAELECLYTDDGNMSLSDLARALQRGADLNPRLRRDVGDDFATNKAEEAFGELADRVRHCGVAKDLYPFKLSKDGSLIQFKPAVKAEKHLFYLYLLFATRANMQQNKVQATIDATQLFEHVCCEVARRYWGGPSPSVEAIVFGTARTDDLEDGAVVDQGKFAARVDDLCRRLREGAKYRAKSDDPVTAKDDKLDVVVWRRFADMRAGQLIGFGQCKTGTHWQRDLIKLVPRNFIDKWWHDPPTVEPIRLYFVTDRVRTQWYNHCKEGGILFDRCRIIEHARNLPDALKSQWERWTKEVIKKEHMKIT